MHWPAEIIFISFGYKHEHSIVILPAGLFSDFLFSDDDIQAIGRK
jgi:hypothetical protein